MEVVNGGGWEVLKVCMGEGRGWGGWWRRRKLGGRDVRTMRNEKEVMEMWIKMVVEAV